MKNNIKNNIICITTALLLSAAVIIVSIEFAFAFKGLYYFDIKHLNITKSANMDSVKIKKIYDYVIYYFRNTKKGSFNPPYITSSKNGKMHFNDVRILLNKLNTTLLILLICIIPLIIFNIKNKKYKFLKLSSIITFFSILLISMPFLINFNKSFDAAHRLIFHNDYWLLDPYKDPIINIYPETFFFHSAMLIVFINIIFCIIFEAIYHKLKT